MSSLSRVSLKAKHKKNDIYYTPITAVKIHIDLVPEKYKNISCKWLDPCYGTGVYYNNFPHDNKDWCEIEYEKDFFDYTDNVDVIMSNPPFSLINKWIDKCIQLNPSCICILFGCYALTPCRLQILENSGYKLTRMSMCRMDNLMGQMFLTVFEKTHEKGIIDYDLGKFKFDTPEDLEK